MSRSAAPVRDRGHRHAAGQTDRSTGEVVREAVRFAVRPTRRNRLHWASWAVALGVELALVVVLRDGRIFAWEQALTRQLQDVPGKQVVFDLSSTPTNVLSLPVLLFVLATAVLTALLGHRGVAVLLLLSVPLHILAYFPKALVDRPRPSSAFAGIEGVGGPQSFPSGHAEYAVTFYGFLVYLLVLRIGGRWVRATVVAGWLVFVLAVGFGRIALGRHWPLDVLTGYLVGLGLLSGLIWLHSAFHASVRGSPPTVRSTSRSASAPGPRPATVNREP